MFIGIYSISQVSVYRTIDPLVDFPLLQQVKGGKVSKPNCLLFEGFIKWGVFELAWFAVYVHVYGQICVGCMGDI